MILKPWTATSSSQPVEASYLLDMDTLPITLVESPPDHLSTHVMTTLVVKLGSIIPKASMSPLS